MALSRDEIHAFYLDYLRRCNQHRFAELGAFVADDVNGPAQGKDAYIAGLQAVVAGFPDYRWDLHELLIDGDRLAARLIGTGTHTGSFRGVAATGRAIRTLELVMYHLRHDKIARCWGDLGSVVRDELVSGRDARSSLSPQTTQKGRNRRA